MKNLEVQSALSKRASFQHTLFDKSSEYFLRDEFLRARLRFLAQNSAYPHSILISGPSGSGKASFAFQLWKSCRDSVRSFVSADCEFIKNEKDLQRLFREADGGHLFLKNITEMPVEVLAVLESLILTVKSIRVIASTRDHPRQFSGMFSTVLTIPPLRKRKEDIRYIVSSLLARRGSMTCSAHAMDVFLSQEWKHEFSELADCVSKCVWFARQENRLFVSKEDVLRSLSFSHIDFWHLEAFINPAVRMSLEKKGLKAFLRDVEALAIAVGLAEHKGNASKLARFLQVPINTLVSRCKVLKRQIGDLQEMMGLN